MIEPVPYVFERLKRNYASERVRVVCCAISERTGEDVFYALKEDHDATLPPWYNQLGSFRRDVVLKSKDFVPNLEQRILEIQVPCMTFNQLITEFNVEKVDLIHIDTEGYDATIIRTIDFSKSSPEILMFEHKHLSKPELRETLQQLRGNNYRCAIGTCDNLCIRRDIKF